MSQTSRECENIMLSLDTLRSCVPYEWVPYEYIPYEWVPYECVSYVAGNTQMREDRSVSRYIERLCAIWLNPIWMNPIWIRHVASNMRMREDHFVSRHVERLCPIWMNPIWMSPILMVPYRHRQHANARRSICLWTPLRSCVPYSWIAYEWVPYEWVMSQATRECEKITLSLDTVEAVAPAFARAGAGGGGTWRDSFICVTWLIYLTVLPGAAIWGGGMRNMCDVTDSSSDCGIYLCSRRSICNSFIFVMWLILRLIVALSFARGGVYITRSYAWRDLFFIIIWVVVLHM